MQLKCCSESAGGQLGSHGALLAACLLQVASLAANFQPNQSTLAVMSPLGVRCNKEMHARCQNCSGLLISSLRALPAPKGTFNLLLHSCTWQSLHLLSRANRICGHASNIAQAEVHQHANHCRYLRVDTSEQPVILTEPPLNAPENRELTAEIMFETFNVPGLYIGMQALLALYASLLAERGATIGQV